MSAIDVAKMQSTCNLCSTLNGKTTATCYTVDEFQKQC